MDTAFVTGMAAFVSAILVFVGSAFLLLTLVLGPRLAYFITASITLCFVLIMAVVWSINPLGPLGQQPQWEELDIGTDSSALEFEASSQYPDEPWAVADAEDDQQIIQSSELESDATKYTKETLEAGELEGLPESAQLVVTEDATRLLQRGDTQYGLTLIDVLPPAVTPELGIPTKKQIKEDEAKAEATGAEEIEPLGQAAVVMQYDPGDPLGKARMIAVGTFILLVLHLFGLSVAERRGRRQTAEATT